jgi:hypothetical protein
MVQRWIACAIPMAAVLAAADTSWKDKPVSEWSQDDARQVLTDSPWAKSVQAKVKNSSGGSHGSRGAMGRPGVGLGGVGIGIPGPRMSGRGGMGRGIPQGSGGGGGQTSSITAPTVTVRWESALPVQEAELKSGNPNAPLMDEDHYAILVLGLPARWARGDADSDASRLKPHAELKRPGGKAIRSSSSRVLTRDDGPVVVFLFPRSQEIPSSDQQIEFEGQIGPLEVNQQFQLNEMTFDGKLQL